jgi:hypothetical protein
MDLYQRSETAQRSQINYQREVVRGLCSRPPRNVADRPALRIFGGVH